MTRFLLVLMLAATAITLSSCGTDTSVPAFEASATSTSPREVTETALEEPVTNDEKTESSSEPVVEKDSVDSTETLESSSTAELEEITFDDLNCNMQADVKFRPFMLTERVSELDGKRIQIKGSMLPDLKQKNITEFVLLKNNTCKFGPGGQADHLIMIKLQDGVATDFKGTEKFYEVTGTLAVNPYEGPGGITYGIYEMAGESVRILSR